MKRAGWLILSAALIAACEPVDDAPEPALRDATAGESEQAVAAPIEVRLQDATGANVGIAHLTQQDDGVQVHVRVTGLEPGSEHGVHIHETGSCEPPGFESAGAHFNPAFTQHGLENAAGPHGGDLPNLRAGDDGVGEITFTQAHVVLRGGPSALESASGRAIVVHAQRDDQLTDPSGNSGARVMCGVAQF